MAKFLGPISYIDNDGQETPLTKEMMETVVRDYLSENKAPNAVHADTADTADNAVHADSADQSTNTIAVAGLPASANVNNGKLMIGNGQIVFRREILKWKNYGDENYTEARNWIISRPNQYTPYGYQEKILETPLANGDILQIEFAPLAYSSGSEGETVYHTSSTQVRTVVIGTCGSYDKAFRLESIEGSVGAQGSIQLTVDSFQITNYPVGGISDYRVLQQIGGYYWDFDYPTGDSSIKRDYGLEILAVYKLII